MKKKQIHILPGDSLVESFPKKLEGEKIICRECLIVGNLQGDTLAEFWKTRAEFIQNEYFQNSYFEKVVSEFEKLDKVDPKTEINLWFEFELFCQTNLWFILNLLQEKNLTNVYRVLPIIKESKDIWKGFGNFGEVELEKCYSERIKLAKKDIDFGAILWKAYKASDLKELKQLSESKSKAFPFLEEVCRAEIERKQNNRVNKSLQEIIVSGAKDFSEVFIQFQEKEGVYGFGDLQVKNNYQQLVSK